jgi:hypothetical protein
MDIDEEGLDFSHQFWIGSVIVLQSVPLFPGGKLSNRGQTNGYRIVEFINPP